MELELLELLEELLEELDEESDDELDELEAGTLDEEPLRLSVR